MGRGARQQTTAMSAGDLDDLLAHSASSSMTAPTWAREANSDWKPVSDRQTLATLQEAAAQSTAAIDALIAGRWKANNTEAKPPETYGQRLERLAAQVVVALDNLLDASLARALRCETQTISEMRSQLEDPFSDHLRKDFTADLHEAANNATADERLRKLIRDNGMTISATSRREIAEALAAEGLQWLARIYGLSYDGRYDGHRYVNDPKFWQHYFTEAAGHAEETTSVVFERYANENLTDPF